MTTDFHAPVNYDLIDSMIDQRNALLARMQELSRAIKDDYGDALRFFVDADPQRSSRYASLVDEIIDLDKGRAYLDAYHWDRALRLTDLMDCMPQARVEEWHELITARDTPPFDEDTVRPTLQGLLLRRSRFVAEKADGVFRRLSGAHVTNLPQGFGKRFIMSYCFDSVLGTASWEAAGHLDDLRGVVAMIMRRDVSAVNTLHSRSVMNYALRFKRGQWVDVDGGALQIRCYKKGTMHIQVHPQIAWQLNLLLHELYPAAIPSDYREPPKRKLKDVPLHDDLLSFPAVQILAGARFDGKSLGYNAYDADKSVKQELARVMEHIGGVWIDGAWQFEYEPQEVIGAIAASGAIPNYQSHQYYPTPDYIAERMVEAAELVPGMSILEPSAGTGNIVDAAPDDRNIACVEVSELHCQVLGSKGYKVHCADFLEWEGGRFDRIVMNPPYSQGRAIAHLEKARDHLAPGGVLVALLPTTYKNRNLPGEWIKDYDRFPGTSISVSIYRERDHAPPDRRNRSHISSTASSRS